MISSVSKITAYLFRADEEKRLRKLLYMKAKQDARRRREEDSVLAALRSDVLSGINERMVRFKGIESSERIALLPGSGGTGSRDNSHDAPVGMTADLQNARAKD